jgi:Protein of unknown function (DUF2510)
MERQSPPGWYRDPEDPSKEWYWDGEKWTESRPRSAAPLGTGKPTGWVVAGYICAVLFPLVGAIIAFVPLRNRDSPHWKPVFWLSIAVILISLALAMLLSL